MKVIAATSEQMLEMVLFRLHVTGWARVDAQKDRKSTRLNSSHIQKSRMPSSA